MNDELKPCPFCGSVNLSVLDYESRHRVECPFCGTRTGNYNSEQDAIEAWNRRVQPTFTPDERDAIKEMFEEHFEGKPHEETIIKQCYAAMKRGD